MIVKWRNIHRKLSSFFERAEQSVGRWTIKPSKRCFETVGSMCSLSWRSWQYGKRKITVKGRGYRKEILDKKRTNLVPRIIRKSSEIDVLLYSHQNDVTVKEQLAVIEELAQLSDIFKLIEDINQEMIKLDDDYTEQLWFTDIDEKVFSFKNKFHNWLGGDEMQRKDEKLRSSCSRSSFKSSSTLSSSKSEKRRSDEQIFKLKQPSCRRKDMQSCKLNCYGLKKKWQTQKPELRSMKEEAQTRR